MHYGHDNRGEPVQLVSARLTAVGEIATLSIRGRTAAAKTDPTKSRRRVWFRNTGEVEATICDRARMPAGYLVTGPAVIESLGSPHSGASGLAGSDE